MNFFINSNEFYSCLNSLHGRSKKSWRKIKNQNGFMLLAILGATTLFLIFASGLAGMVVYQNKLYQQQTSKMQSLHIAEAGINYYVWHLAHSQQDYYDGTGTDPGPSGAPYGPYVHTYTSPTGDAAGTYSLEITPPPTGSTIVKIKSTGWMNNFPNIKRTIEVKYGIPSLAHYSFLTNNDIWFGTNETVSGEMHSNGGIRMDGWNDSVMSSARPNYICQSGHGCNTQATCNNPCTWTAASSTCQCPGIWGIGANNALWNFPVTDVNFNNITVDIQKMWNMATSSGVYLGPYNPASQDKGYHITFKNNGTFDVYKISRLQSAVSQYNDSWSAYTDIAEQIRDEAFYRNYAIPANGIIYVDDEVWVDGIVKGRATLLAATLPDNVNTRRTIIINGNLTYLAHDGTNILGLIAQKHIKVPRYAPSTLNIDAIMLAQNNRVFRNKYATPSIKSSITVYGGVITNQVWTWTWVDNNNNVTDGYTNTSANYDSQVTFSPPPSFPTTNEYTFISWNEY